jgi:hypothetical protein
MKFHGDAIFTHRVNILKTSLVRIDQKAVMKLDEGMKPYLHAWCCSAACWLFVRVTD